MKTFQAFQFFTILSALIKIFSIPNMIISNSDFVHALQNVLIA